MGGYQSTATCEQQCGKRITDAVDEQNLLFQRFKAQCEELENRCSKADSVMKLRKINEIMGSLDANDYKIYQIKELLGERKIQKKELDKQEFFNEWIEDKPQSEKSVIYIEDLRDFFDKQEEIKENVIYVMANPFTAIIYRDSDSIEDEILYYPIKYNNEIPESYGIKKIGKRSFDNPLIDNDSSFVFALMLIQNFLRREDTFINFFGRKVHDINDFDVDRYRKTILGYE